MKIMNREQFLAMPSGTVFSKYVPCLFEDLQIKGETWGNDFQVQEIASAVYSNELMEFVRSLDASRATGQSVKMDFDCMGRDGCFDDDQLFAVWEQTDVAALITRLLQAMTESAQ